MTKVTSARFRHRPLTAWLERFGALVLALALLAGLMSPTAAQDATPAATPVESTPATPGSGILGLGGADITATVDAMLAVQGADGGFIGLSGDSDPGVTADAVIGLAAAEEAGVDAGDAIDEALGYLEATGADYAATGAGQRAKLVLAVEAGGDDASSFGGEDIWAPIQATTGSSDLTVTGSFSLSLVVLASVVIESDRTAEFTDLLVADQLEDGSWSSTSDAASGEGDTNTTALAIQALVATGDVEDPAIEAGLGYIATVRAADGGYAYQTPVDGAPIVPDANSSALVLQALVATMTSVDDPTFQQDAAALAAFQNDSGQFRYTIDTPDDNFFATVQALPAIAGLPLPIVA